MDRKDWLMVACTAAILATLIGCTWWHAQAIERAIPSYPVYNDSLVAIERNTAKQVVAFDSIQDKLDAIEIAVNKLRSEQSMRELTRR